MKKALLRTIQIGSATSNQQDTGDNAAAAAAGGGGTQDWLS
jgi:hypothetical protein